SGSANGEERQQAIALGAYAFVSKPFAMQTLFDLLITYARLRRATRRHGDTATRGAMNGSSRCPSLAVSPRRRVAASPRPSLSGFYPIQARQAWRCGARAEVTRVCRGCRARHQSLKRLAMSTANKTRSTTV